MRHQYVSTTKIGPDGRPIKESYQSKAHGVYGKDRKPEILERKQMYQNTHTGLEKAAMERMLHGKGRKVVYENDRNSGHQNSYNYYKNMRDTEGQDFDREWESAAKKFGLKSGGNSLPYGTGHVKNYQRSNTGGYGDSDSYYRGPYQDERRRGYYIDDGLKGEDMPVRTNNQPPTHIERLLPVDTSHRMDIPNNRAINGDAPLALPSNANRDQVNRAAARNINAGNINARAPPRVKPARIG